LNETSSSLKDILIGVYLNERRKGKNLSPLLPCNEEVQMRWNPVGIKNSTECREKGKRGKTILFLVFGHIICCCIVITTRYHYTPLGENNQIVKTFGAITT
jgi:hypothetical protein